MKSLRTPDQQFENLVDYPFTPNYLQIADGEGGELRIHYVDEGHADAPVVLLLHGQPTWSYLYRHMIPPLVAAGFRVIAPDLIGFGRSDKPTEIDDYSYARHVAWMTEWMDKLELQDITLFCQDWGSLIGLRMVADVPERFKHVVLANGGLPAGVIPKLPSKILKWLYPKIAVVTAAELPQRLSAKWAVPGFFYWRKYAAESPLFKVGDVLKITSKEPLSDAVVAGYEAPFPDQSYMAGARKFPMLVPILADEPGVEDNKAAWRKLREFNKPFLLAFSDKDPVTKGGDKKFAEQVPGCQGVPHRTIKPAGHFLQEDAPQQCVQAILDVVKYGQK